MTKWKARADANQPDMVKELRLMGYAVEHTHRLGSGFPDLCVAGHSHKFGCFVTLLVEVKDGKRKLTQDEIEFANRYPGPLIVARSAEDVQHWFEQE